jgi:hypothetical protein
MKLVTGSILNAPKNHALVIPVNTAGVPGAGLARTAARKYPLWAEAYTQACQSGLLARAGDVVFHPLPRNPHPLMVSFATKGRDWKRPSRLEAIARGLDALALALRRQPRPLAVPALGCGLGGLDFWLQVYPLLESKLGRFDDVLVYQPYHRSEHGR